MSLVAFHMKGRSARHKYGKTEGAQTGKHLHSTAGPLPSAAAPREAIYGGTSEIQPYEEESSRSGSLQEQNHRRQTETGSRRAAPAPAVPPGGPELPEASRLTTEGPIPLVAKAIPQAHPRGSQGSFTKGVSTGIEPSADAAPARSGNHALHVGVPIANDPQGFLNEDLSTGYGQQPRSLAPSQGRPSKPAYYEDLSSREGLALNGGSQALEWEGRGKIAPDPPASTGPALASATDAAERELPEGSQTPERRRAFSVPEGPFQGTRGPTQSPERDPTEWLLDSFTAPARSATDSLVGNLPPGSPSTRAVAFLRLNDPPRSPGGVLQDAYDRAVHEVLALDKRKPRPLSGILPGQLSRLSPGLPTRNMNGGPLPSADPELPPGLALARVRTARSTTGTAEDGTSEPWGSHQETGKIPGTGTPGGRGSGAVPSRGLKEDAEALLLSHTDTLSSRPSMYDTTESLSDVLRLQTAGGGLEALSGAGTHEGLPLPALVGGYSNQAFDAELPLLPHVGPRAAPPATAGGARVPEFLGTPERVPHSLHRDQPPETPSEHYATPAPANLKSGDFGTPILPAPQEGSVPASTASVATLSVTTKSPPTPGEPLGVEAATEPLRASAILTKALEEPGPAAGDPSSKVPLQETAREVSQAAKEEPERVLHGELGPSETRLPQPQNQRDAGDGTVAPVPLAGDAELLVPQEGLDDSSEVFSAIHARLGQKLLQTKLSSKSREDNEAGKGEVPPVLPVLADIHLDGLGLGNPGLHRAHPGREHGSWDTSGEPRWVPDPTDLPINGLRDPSRPAKRPVGGQLLPNGDRVVGPAETGSPTSPPTDSHGGVGNAEVNPKRRSFFRLGSRSKPTSSAEASDAESKGAQFRGGRRRGKTGVPGPASGPGTSDDGSSGTFDVSGVSSGADEPRGEKPKQAAIRTFLTKLTGSFDKAKAAGKAPVGTKPAGEGGPSAHVAVVGGGYDADIDTTPKAPLTGAVSGGETTRTSFEDPLESSGAPSGLRGPQETGGDPTAAILAIPVPLLLTGGSAEPLRRITEEGEEPGHLVSASQQAGVPAPAGAIIPGDGNLNVRADADLPSSVAQAPAQTGDVGSAAALHPGTALQGRLTAHQLADQILSDDSDTLELLEDADGSDPPLTVGAAKQIPSMSSPVRSPSLVAGESLPTAGPTQPRDTAHAPTGNSHGAFMGGTGGTGPSEAEALERKRPESTQDDGGVVSGSTGTFSAPYPLVTGNPFAPGGPPAGAGSGAAASVSDATRPGEGSVNCRAGAAPDVGTGPPNQRGDSTLNPLDSPTAASSRLLYHAVIAEKGSTPRAGGSEAEKHEESARPGPLDMTPPASGSLDADAVSQWVPAPDEGTGGAAPSEQALLGDPDAKTDASKVSEPGTLGLIVRGVASLLWGGRASSNAIDQVPTEADEGAVSPKEDAPRKGTSKEAESSGVPGSQVEESPEAEFSLPGDSVLIRHSGQDELHLDDNLASDSVFVGADGKGAPQSSGGKMQGESVLLAPEGHAGIPASTTSQEGLLSANHISAGVGGGASGESAPAVGTAPGAIPAAKVPVAPTLLHSKEPASESTHMPGQWDTSRPDKVELLLRDAAEGSDLIKSRRASDEDTGALVPSKGRDDQSLEPATMTPPHGQKEMHGLGNAGDSNLGLVTSIATSLQPALIRTSDPDFLTIDLIGSDSVPAPASSPAKSRGLSSSELVGAEKDILASKALVSAEAAAQKSTALSSVVLPIPGIDLPATPKPHGSGSDEVAISVPVRKTSSPDWDTLQGPPSPFASGPRGFRAGDSADDRAAAANRQDSVAESVASSSLPTKVEPNSSAPPAKLGNAGTSEPAAQPQRAFGASDFANGGDRTLGSPDRAVSPTSLAQASGAGRAPLQAHPEYERGSADISKFLKGRSSTSAGSDASSPMAHPEYERGSADVSKFIKGRRSTSAGSDATSPMAHPEYERGSADVSKFIKGRLSTSLGSDASSPMAHPEHERGSADISKFLKGRLSTSADSEASSPMAHPGNERGSADIAKSGKVELPAPAGFGLSLGDPSRWMVAAPRYSGLLETGGTPQGPDVVGTDSPHVPKYDREPSLAHLAAAVSSAVSGADGGTVRTGNAAFSLAEAGNFSDALASSAGVAAGNPRGSSFGESNSKGAATGQAGNSSPQQYLGSTMDPARATAKGSRPSTRGVRQGSEGSRARSGRPGSRGSSQGAGADVDFPSGLAVRTGSRGSSRGSVRLHELPHQASPHDVPNQALLPSSFGNSPLFTEPTSTTEAVILDSHGLHTVPDSSANSFRRPSSSESGRTAGDAMAAASASVPVFLDGHGMHMAGEAEGSRSGPLGTQEPQASPLLGLSKTNRGSYDFEEGPVFLTVGGLHAPGLGREINGGGGQYEPSSPLWLPTDRPWTQADEEEALVNVALPYPEEDVPPQPPASQRRRSSKLKPWQAELRSSVLASHTSVGSSFDGTGGGTAYTASEVSSSHSSFTEPQSGLSTPARRLSAASRAIRSASGGLPESALRRPRSDASERVDADASGPALVDAEERLRASSLPLDVAPPGAVHGGAAARGAAAPASRRKLFAGDGDMKSYAIASLTSESGSDADRAPALGGRSGSGDMRVSRYPPRRLSGLSRSESEDELFLDAVEDLPLTL
eukprot:jgi/Botrbrau1/8287/Bobra.0251s0016.1